MQRKKLAGLWRTIRRTDFWARLGKSPRGPQAGATALNKKTCTELMVQLHGIHVIDRVLRELALQAIAMQNFPS